MSARRSTNDEPQSLPPALEPLVLSREPLCLALPRSRFSKLVGSLAMGALGLAAIALLIDAVAPATLPDAAAVVHWGRLLGFLVGIPCALHLGTSARRLELRFEPHRLVLLEAPYLGRKRTSELARARVSGARVVPGGRKTFFDWVLAVQVGANHPPWRVAGNQWIEKWVLEAVAELIRRWAERVPESAPGGDIGRARTAEPTLRCPRCASAVRPSEGEQTVWRVRCGACEARFDAALHRVAEGPFRDRSVFEATAEVPSPAAWLRDISGDGWLRRVAIAPERRPRILQRSLPGFIGFVFVVFGIESLVQGIPSGHGLAAALFALAICSLGLLLFWLAIDDRREAIGIRDGLLVWTRRVGPWRRTQTLPVASAQSISASVGRTAPSLLEPGDRFFLAITSASAPGSGMWQVGLGQDPAGLEWLAGHLRAGLEVLDRAG